MWSSYIEALQRISSIFSTPPYFLPPPVSTQGGICISSTGAIAEEDPEVHLGLLKRFSLRGLQVVTDTSSNKKILGRGGFGKVWMPCRWLTCGCETAKRRAYAWWGATVSNRGRDDRHGCA